MTSRRKPHTPAAPRLDSAPDADELYPCTVDRLNREATARLNGTKVEPTPYDVLIDVISGPVFDKALRDATEICKSCPIMAACHRDNRDEPWVRALYGRNRTEPRKPVSYPAMQAAARAKAQQFNDDRAQDLRELIADGVHIDQVLTRLNVNRDALWRWCKRNGHRDLWFALNPVEEQVIARPKRRKAAA